MQCLFHSFETSKFRPEHAHEKAVRACIRETSYISSSLREVSEIFQLCNSPLFSQIHTLRFRYQGKNLLHKTHLVKY